MTPKQIDGLRAMAVRGNLDEPFQFRAALRGTEGMAAVAYSDVMSKHPRVFIQGEGSRAGMEGPAASVDVAEEMTLFAFARAENEWQEHKTIELVLNAEMRDSRSLGLAPMQQPDDGEGGGVGLVFAAPELYPAVIFDDKYAPHDGGAVVPIGRRRYRVAYKRDSYGPLGEGDAAKVVFEETFDPLTPFSIAPAEHQNGNVIPNAKYTRSTVWFGQPEFRQHQVLPVFGGKAASALFRIYNCFSDSGIENVFVSLDDDGRPVAVWHTADCS